MSSLGSPNSFFLAGKKAYEVERSLRFNDGDNTYLNRTPSSTGNRRTFTWSGWIKRSKLDASDNAHVFFDSRDGESQTIECTFGFLTNNTFFFDVTGAGIRTNALFRDVSAWQHWVIAVDTTQATSSNRVKIYVNGVQETSFSSANYPSQNYETAINAQYLHSIGRYNNGGHHDGYMAEVNFINGLQLTPASFGATDVITGQWNPKKYTGSYGTNGFYLNFSDNSGTTATTLGKDSSGNGNNFTPNNFGTGDAVKDSPTNNFCNFLSIQKTAETTFSEGNLKATSSNSHKTFYGNFGLRSGKWYWEGLAVAGSTTKWTYGVSDIENTKNTQISGQNYLLAVSSGSPSDATYAFGDAVSIYNTNLYKNGSVVSSSYQTTPSAGDIIGIALDVDTGKVWFARNGTWINGSATASTTLNESSHDTTVATGKVYNAAFSAENCSWQTNFGQDSSFSNAKTAQGNTDGNTQGDFYYAVPSGFKALCSANLPDPTILLPNKHFETELYTGTSSTVTVNTLEFQPDWVWCKVRSKANRHALFDSVRGATKRIHSNLTDAEVTDADTLTSFNSNGFTIGADAGDSGSNANGHTFVAWNWNGGDTDGKTYTVTVVDDSGNKYRFDGFGTSAVTLDLAEGGTYIFNYPSAHPLKFSTTSDGTHGGGSEYTTGVTHNSSTQVTIVVAASAPTLYYYCSSHSGMGGAVNTNSTLGSSNFDGTTQSTAKVNATAGLSIVTYTGTGSGANIGHGLGVAPQVVITKARSATSGWAVLHTVGDPNAEYRLVLNDNGGYSSYQGGNLWNDTVPTSTHFRVSSDASTNASGVTYVGYVFSEVAGYSKFGKYTGNGSTDGTFVFTGFRPALVTVKQTSGSNNWVTWDNAREPNNEMQTVLEWNASSADGASQYTAIDFLSNGFKHRTDFVRSNTSGGTYIYFAWAEAPFKNARAR